MRAAGDDARAACAVSRTEINRWWCQAGESGDASLSGSAMDEAAGDILRRASVAVHVRRGGQVALCWVAGGLATRW